MNMHNNQICIINLCSAIWS